MAWNGGTAVPASLENQAQVTGTFVQHSRAPLFEALRDYAKKDMAPFHTPGHKQGGGIDPEFLDLLGRNVFAIDLTELPEVDNLHDPDHVIREAQELAAAAYGSDRAFFLMNGSTSGNNVGVLSVCDPGDKLIIPRNSHKSVIGGIILGGAVPIYVMPEWDSELGLAHGVTPQSIKETILRHPDAKGVFLVNPTYYGSTIDLKSIAEVCHEHGLPLLVDEAHGPHLHFHDELPPSALSCGADLVVQSTHKILSAMTQSSLLHVRGNRIDVKRVKNVLQLLQSTSPSYVLMASLDVARRQMVLHGRDFLGDTIALARWAREELNKIPGVQCFGEEKIGRPGLFGLDVTKLTVNVAGLGLTGFEAIDLLNERFNIQSEMATLYNVLEIVSIGNSRKHLERLVQALQTLSDENQGRAALTPVPTPPIPDLPEMAVTPREAFFAPVKRIPFPESVGEICAEIVAPYPPGIPILVPGERITPAIVEYLTVIHSHGAFINGPEDVRLSTIKVVDRG